MISLREFDELAAAERGQGPPWFATVFQHRFGAAQRHLRELAANGALGRPLLAVCRTTWFRDQAYFDVPWRGRWAMPTEDLPLADVTFANGAVASVLNSVLSPREESYLRFDFERATVEVTHLYGYGDDDWRVTAAPGHEDEVRDGLLHRDERRARGVVMSLRHDETEVTALAGDLELFRYVFGPSDAQLESPRPFFHPVRTLRGDLVSLYRPHHAWHKGIALSLPHLGSENFWGGPTFRDGGYVQARNDGAMRHDAFEEAVAKDDVLRLDERLTWVTEAGQTPVTERRRIAATVWPEDAAWLLAFETTMTNVSGAEIVIGSPTTAGRPNAGYGGLFWRGPRSFTGGTVRTHG